MKKQVKICYLIGLSVLFMVLFGMPALAATEKITIKGNRDYGMAYEILDMVNQERAAAGLGSLTMDTDLLETAMKRAQECAVYYAHTRPNGESCFTAYPSRLAAGAENIALGYNGAQEVMNGWMNSDGHKQNILKSGMKSIGVGVFYHNGCYYYVQNFSTTTAATATKTTAVRETTAEVSVLSDYLPNQAAVAYSGRSPLQIKETATVFLEIYNRGTSSRRIRPLSPGAVYTSSNPSVVTVDATGKVTGVSAGTAQITAAWAGHPDTKAVYTITVAGYYLSAVNVSLPTSVYTYTGSEIKPEPVVTYNGITLVKDQDYKLSYVANKDVGRGALAVSGIGQYTGDVILYFTIKAVDSSGSNQGDNSGSDSSDSNQGDNSGLDDSDSNQGDNSGLDGADQKQDIVPRVSLRSVMIKRSFFKKTITLKWKKLSGISGYEIQYATKANFKNKKIKTISKKKSSVTIKLPSVNKKYYVRMCAYKKVKGKKVYGKYTSKYVVKK